MSEESSTHTTQNAAEALASMTGRPIEDFIPDEDIPDFENQDLVEADGELVPPSERWDDDG